MDGSLLQNTDTGKSILQIMPPLIVIAVLLQRMESACLPLMKEKEGVKEKERHLGYLHIIQYYRLKALSFQQLF